MILTVILRIAETVVAAILSAIFCKRLKVAQTKHYRPIRKGREKHKIQGVFSILIEFRLDFIGVLLGIRYFLHTLYEKEHKL